jgi:hypothetical protein
VPRLTALAEIYAVLTQEPRLAGIFW